MVAQDKTVSHQRELVFGCMGFGGDWDSSHYQPTHIELANRAVDSALESGIRIFDHADIYTRGKAEQVFGDVLKQRPHLRDLMFIQSKCGIRLADEFGPGRYDSSEQWIIQSVEGSLKRLNIEQLDRLLLHRPDPLMDAEVVAEAIRKLHLQGKVKSFGVSNMTAMQMTLIQNALDIPIHCNQIELSLGHIDCIDQGIIANVSGEKSDNGMAGTLEYCQLNKIQIQAWGSLSQGLFSGRTLTDQPEAVIQTAQLVQNLALEYQVSREAIVLAFLFKLPQNILPVIGTVNPERIKACAEGVAVELSREHWYQLFVSARGRSVP